MAKSPIKKLASIDDKEISSYIPYLLYKGKKDEDTIRRNTLSTPFQPIEKYGRSKKNEWVNKLIWGDNAQALQYLKKEYKGKIKLIYIDPPFATKSDYTNGEVKAYRDKLAGADFIEFLRERLVLLKDLLADDGSIYVHLDTKMNSYVRVVMDEIFGKDNFVNEIVWFYRRWSASSNSFQNMHDTILFYSKTHNKIFNKQYIPTSITRSKMKRGYNTNTYMNNGERKKQVIVENKEEFDKRVEMGSIDLSKYEKVVYKEQEGTLAFDVFEIPIINPQAKERNGYPTQKPEELLERIIKASSNEEDIVLDCFCGSGTTLAVAEKLNRKWIGVDAGKVALYTTRKRILDLGDYKAFTVYNSGVYNMKKVPEWRYTGRYSQGAVQRICLCLVWY